MITLDKNIGGKAANLVRLRDHGYNVPSFTVMDSDYLSKKLHPPSSDIRSAINKVHFSEAEIARFLPKGHVEGSFFAVRSSGGDEDGTDASFAGQFETKLFVSKETLVSAIKEVWLSGYSDRVQKYREMNQLDASPQFSIIIQLMIPATSAGVAFTANPVTQDPEEYCISSVWGVGDGLVDGSLDADNFYVREGIIRHEIATKSFIHNYTDEGFQKRTLDHKKKNIASLSDTQILKLADTLNEIQKMYGAPQDVEFAFVNTELYILQSRPISSMNIDLSAKIVWDNSNIIESYPGVSSPLTFSFIKEMYEKVYVQFAELMGVSPKDISNNIGVYENMLGHLRGRVYYNLKSWYQALAMLPGYTLNAGFMETMMGVKSSFELDERFKSSRIKAISRLGISITKMLTAFIGLGRQRKSFLKKVDTTIQQYKKMDFDAMEPEALERAYSQFEQLLTKEWKAPLINDFFAMIFFGLFKKHVETIAPENHEQLINQLLIGSDDIVSVLPMRHSIDIANRILEDPEAIQLFSGEANQVWSKLKNGALPSIYSSICAYLDRFGERCLAELKLETISYTQDPSRFIKILQGYIKEPQFLRKNDSGSDHQLRNEAEKEYTSLTKKGLLSRFKSTFLLRQARDLVSNRENLRFERTRGFGIVRQLFSSMGRAFASRNWIVNERDIFYLTKEEIFEAIKLKGSVDLTSTIDTRKEEYKAFEEESLPERITSYGNLDETVERLRHTKIEFKEGDLKGIPCCPGIVESEVMVISSPDQVEGLDGKIMVTTATDPGWVSLFPTASGILVERGSLLSHSAIVARELGIPCIVSISHITQQLKSGDVVIMNGATGVIEKKSNG